jgi:hypothetical protein
MNTDTVPGNAAATVRRGRLTRASLLGLEQYAVQRDAFRREVLAHKRNRAVVLSPHARLLFEDALTVRYQVQEMLRAERIFEPDAIEEELAAYNPLIPDGTNWKATLLIEYEDVAERRLALAALRGVEHHVWAQAGDGQRTLAIANEDLPRSNDEKTAAVHFLRFELDAAAIAALRAGAPLRVGIEHEALACAVTVPDAVRASLLDDLA